MSAVDSQGGGTLLVPAGVYTVDPEVINVHSNTTVSGTAATIRSSGRGYSLLGWSGSSVAVDGLTVDGANAVLHVVEIGANLHGVTMRSTTVENAGQSSDPASPNYSSQVVGIRVEGGGTNMLFDSIIRWSARHLPNRELVGKCRCLHGGEAAVAPHGRVADARRSPPSPRSASPLLADLSAQYQPRTELRPEYGRYPP